MPADSAEIDEIVQSGDRAAARVTVRAEHTGDLMTPVFDSASFMAQLGLA